MYPFPVEPVAIVGALKVRVVQFPGLATVPAAFCVYVFDTWTENVPVGDPVQLTSYPIWDKFWMTVTAEMT